MLRNCLKVILPGWAALAAAAAPAPAQEPPPETLRIVFIAYENPDQLLDDVKPVLEYLKPKVGAEIRHFTATDYGAVVEALRNKSADVGFMGPLQYVLAHAQSGAEAILGEIYSGKSTYVSRIFVRKDSGITKPEDLRGKTIAFVDPVSSSGYLYPLEIFRSRGLIQKAEDAETFFRRIYMPGGDEPAIGAVVHGFADAAGVGQYAFNLLRPEDRDRVTWIAESEPIPSHCVGVRKDLNKETVEKIRAALLALNEGPNRRLLENLYNVDGYVRVTHENFKGVERLARQYGFIKKIDPR